MLQTLEAQIRYFPSIQIDVHKTHDGHLIETVTYGGQEYQKTIVALSSQIGCPASCDFCLVGERRFARNIDPQEHLEQVRSALEGNDKSPWLDPKKEVKVSLCRSGDPLLNPHTPKGVMKIAQSLSPSYPLHFQLASIMPEKELSHRILDELADFAEDYRYNVQLMISLHTTDEQKRDEMIAYSPLMDFSSIAQTGQRWFKRTGQKRKVNLSFALMNDNEVDVSFLQTMFDPTIFAIRLGFYLPTTPQKANIHPQSSMSRLQELKEAVQKAGYQCIESIAREVERKWECRSESAFKLLRQPYSQS